MAKPLLILALASILAAPAFAGPAANPSHSLLVQAAPVAQAVAYPGRRAMQNFPRRQAHGLFQSVGRYHASLVLCAIVPPTAASDLKQQAYAALAARGLDMDSFPRDYEIGYQGAIIKFRVMSRHQKTIYCAAATRASGRRSM